MPIISLCPFVSLYLSFLSVYSSLYTYIFSLSIRLPLPIFSLCPCIRLSAVSPGRNLSMSSISSCYIGFTNERIDAYRRALVLKRLVAQLLHTCCRFVPNPYRKYTNWDNHLDNVALPILCRCGRCHCCCCFCSTSTLSLSLFFFVIVLAGCVRNWKLNRFLSDVFDSLHLL